MNVKPKFVYYDIRRKQSVCLIMYTHENDVDTQVLEVSMLDDGEPIELDADYIYSAAIVNRETKALINNSIECSLNGSGNVEIPVDNFHQLGAQDLLIELTITDSNGNQVLVTPFPLWIHVNTSILDNAQVTPDSKGTIPDLLEEAIDALEATKDYENLENKPKINHVELIGDKSSDDLGLQDKLTAGRNIIITNENVISANVNSIVGAYVRNGYLYIKIQDGEGIVSVEQVGYVRGSDGSNGRNGDGFTNAQINANGDLLVTTITYPNGNDYPVGTVVNLGHVQGASDYNSLSNKPQINGVELTGNKSSDALDLQKKLIPGNNITLNENGLISAISNIVTAAAVNQNGTITITLSDGTTVTSTGAVIESTSNKVTTIDANSTNAEYPSAKAVYDAIQDISPPKTDISSATVTLSASSFTYDGTSKAPSVTSVALNGTTLTEGTDYVVVAAPATNAGSYALTVNGIGDYTGTVTANWSIAKAQAVISGDSTITISENDSPVSKTYTSDSDGAFSFSISDNTVASISNDGGKVTVTPLTVGTATITVTLAEGTNYLGATKTVALTVSQVVTHTVFGVCWDYSLSSPALTRLTPQTDPLDVVTNVPSTEPTACVGNDGNGQSDFDNYMPWSGMVRKNYVNGQIVDFTGYNNGETYVYIPEFWSKIVDDTANNRMYFYISSGELTGFTKHLGSDRYVGRYKCNGGLKSRPGSLSVSQTMHNFRMNLKTTDANYYLYDIHAYNALQLLYLVEFSNFNIRSKIGVGITSGASQNNGGTDTLIYHTGRVSGTENVSAVQYRWIENLYGNVWEFIDGVVINNKLVYICSDPLKYGDTVNDYTSTGLYLPEENDFVKKLHGYGNCYLFPKEHGGSESTYVCAKGGANASGNNSLRTGGSFDSGETFGSGLFTSASDGFTWGAANRGARQMIIVGGAS